MRPWRTLAAIAIAVGLAPVSADAQKGYPNIEKSLALGPGDTVMVLSRFVSESGPAMRAPGKRLDFQIRTTIPVSDAKGRVDQADRAAQQFGAQAVDLGIRRISIGICDTKECAERRHPPAEWYLYERTSTGWKRAP
jgi:hypothetical protein